MLTRSGLGLFIANANLDAIGSDYIQSARFFSDASIGSNAFKSLNAIVYRPQALTAADRFRYAGVYDHSAQRLHVQGGAYTDVTATDEDVEIWFHDIGPDTDVLFSVQRAQEWLGARTLIPLTLVANGGGFSTTTGWTPSGATLAVEAAVMQGRGSLEVSNSGANGLAKSTAFGVTPGARLHAWALGQGDSGTNRVLYTDETNTAQAGVTQTFTARRPTVAYQALTVPDGCHEMSVSIGGVEDDAVTRWDAVFINQEKDGRLFLPSTIQEAWEFESLAYMRFTSQIENGIYDAMSLDMQEISPSDYRVSDLGADTNTPVVQLDTKAWLRYPLVIQARLRDSSVELLEAESDVTVQPLAMLAARATIELVEAQGAKIPAAREIAQIALADLNRTALRRPANGPSRRGYPLRYVWTP